MTTIIISENYNLHNNVYHINHYNNIIYVIDLICEEQILMDLCFYMKYLKRAL